MININGASISSCITPVLIAKGHERIVAPEDRLDMSTGRIKHESPRQFFQTCHNVVGSQR